MESRSRHLDNEKLAADGSPPNALYVGDHAAGASLDREAGRDTEKNVNVFSEAVEYHPHYLESVHTKVVKNKDKVPPMSRIPKESHTKTIGRGTSSFPDLPEAAFIVDGPASGKLLERLRPPEITEPDGHTPLASSESVPPSYNLPKTAPDDTHARL